MTWRMSVLGAVFALTGCAQQSAHPSTRTPWIAGWRSDTQPRAFAAQFMTEPDGAHSDLPLLGVAAGTQLTVDAFDYANSEPGVSCDGRISFGIDGDLVRIDATARASSDGTSGVGLNAFMGDFVLCYRAPAGATSVRFIAEVSLPETMDVSGSMATVGYFLTLGDDRCFGGVGIDPTSLTRMPIGNGRVECLSDVAVGIDGMACLQSRDSLAFSAFANAHLAGTGTGAGSIHAVATIHAEIP